MCAHASSPCTSRVPQVIVATSRLLNAPLQCRAATWGRCSRSASAMRICPEARRAPIAIAAATSAAAESHGSNAHHTRSSSGSTRRRVSSAIAGNRRAPAIASWRTPSSIATRSSSSDVAANSESNIHSNVLRSTDTDSVQDDHQISRPRRADRLLGMTTRHAVIDSPLGDLTLVADGDALIGLYFHRHWYRPSADTFGPRVDAGSDTLLAESRAQLDDYLAGKRAHFDLPRALPDDDLRRQVWNRLTTIPYGETITYGELAD